MLLLAWVGVVPTVPTTTPVKIVGPSAVEPYKLVELTAEGDLTGAAVVWDVTPDDVADVRELPGGRLIFVGPPGVYKVKARVIRTKDGQLSVETQRFTVTIGKGPGPGPDPPPTDPLVLALQTAYTSDPGAPADKAKWKSALAALYRRGTIAANDANVKTAGDLHSILKTASNSLLPADALPATRARVAQELTATLPTKPDAVLTADDRAKAAAKFEQLAAALEQVK